MNDKRSERLKDFQGRVDYAHDSVHRHKITGWRYIPIHPFSDEIELLDKLGMDASDCKSVDAWSEIDGDVCLVQIYADDGDSGFREGYYSLPDSTEFAHTYLVARLPVDNIDRDIFEAVMQHFSYLGFPSWSGKYRTENSYFELS